MLIPPKGAYKSWRARCNDPHTGGYEWVRLNPIELPNADARREWAVQKSKSVAREAMQLELGGARKVRKPLKDAVNEYFENAENRLGEGTIELYRAAADLLQDWAKRDGVETTDQLTAALLPNFRDFLLAQRKHGMATGGKRGQRKKTREKLSPTTVNWQQRAVKTILNDWRIRKLVRLSRDDIADALKPVNVPREAPEFLRPDECRKLLEAAIKHDEDTFALTRAEKTGKGESGSTRKYEPIAPFVAFVLLTGMRANEARTVRWSAIDLTAKNGDGAEVGEIRLTAKDTKTKYARTVTLEVAPSLVKMLKAMKEKSNGPYVFGGKAPMTETLALASRRRLVSNYGAPADFTWQVLRSTCGTYLTNAPSIFGAASAYRSAKQLGHSVTVAERHYAGLISVSREARTLEAAMAIALEMVTIAASS